MNGDPPPADRAAPSAPDGSEPAAPGVVVGEVQLILAEKRTSLAVLRTGIAIAVIPMSLTTVLVTLSRFYSWVDNLQFLVPLALLCAALVALSAYLIVRALGRIRHHDEVIRRIRRANPAMREFIDGG